jgi:hypothetical protein
VAKYAFLKIENRMLDQLIFFGSDKGFDIDMTTSDIDMTLTLICILGKLENRMLSIFRPDREDVPGGRTELRREELHNFASSLYIKG